MDRLPEELLCYIFEPLEPRELRNLSLTSKIFSRVATPYLYNRTCLKRPFLYGQLKQIKLYLNTLYSSPQLRRLVQHVELGEWEDGYPKTPKFPRLSKRQANDIIRTALGLLSGPFTHELKYHLRRSSQDAISAVILCLVPNLKTLTLNMTRKAWDIDDQDLRTDPTEFNRNRVARLVEISTTPTFIGPDLLSRLTNIHLNGRLCLDENKDGWDVRIVSIFIKLPSLRGFTGVGSRDVSSSSEWACQEDASNVKEMAISNCKIGLSSIQNILRSCRALEAFECLRICEHYHDDDISCEYSCLGLNEMLAKHRHSLQRLRIHSTDCGHRDEVCENPRIGSLVALEGLKFLEIDEVTLYGQMLYEDLCLDKVLPASLEHVIYHASSCCKQDGLFTQVGEWLLTNKTLRSFEVFGANFGHMELISYQMPAIVFEEKGHRRAIVRRKEPKPFA